MLLWSKQWKIVNDCSISFMKNEKTHTKISEKILQRDKIFLNPEKYSNYTEQDFKFIVIWTCLMNPTNKIGILKILQNYTKDELKSIQNEKTKIIYYNNTLNKDKNVLNEYRMNFLLAKELFKTGKISIIGLWYYIHDKSPEGRIQSKFYDKIRYFISYFKKIDQFIKEQNA